MSDDPTGPLGTAMREVTFPDRSRGIILVKAGTPQDEAEGSGLSACAEASPGDVGACARTGSLSSAPHAAGCETTMLMLCTSAFLQLDRDWLPESGRTPASAFGVRPLMGKPS